MSNLWKIYGLAGTNKTFLTEVDALAGKIRPRKFDNKLYQEDLVLVDKFLIKWFCPLGHLDVQLFYDMVGCKSLWERFADVVMVGGLDTTALDPSDPESQALWQVFGLACIDPWRNKDGNNAVVGFRQELQNSINAADKFGFKLNQQQKDKIQAALNKVGILEAFEGVAMMWDPLSEEMITRRSGYPRLQPVQLPPGWIDFTKP